MVIHLYHHGCMICSLSQSILESVKELASLLYNEMYNFCSQQLDNCSELDPLSTDDHPVMLGPITRRLACEVELTVKIPVMQL